MNFRNNFTAKPSKGEVNTEPSLTIPGQTLSLKELVARYTRGQSVETFTPTYDDGYFPDVERLDKIEKIELARALKGKIRETQRSKPEPEKAPQPIPNPPNESGG